MPKKRIGLLLTGLFIVAAAAVWLFVLGPGKRGKAARDRDANILLITLDTTRPDRLGAYGYGKAVTPNIDEISRQGVLFRNAYAPVPITFPSHASMFTGTYPLFHKVRNNGTYVLVPQAETLAEILKAAGYATSAFVSSFTLDSRFGIDQGFDVYDDRMDDSSKLKNLESERRASGTFAAFKAWLEDNSGKKFFSWVHFYDPHFPYDPPEPVRSDGRLTDPYDGEIAYMDTHIGEILGLLRKKGIFEKTLIILAGDHGEAFGEHGEYGHTIFGYEENIRVPLVFHEASAFPRGLSVSDPVNLIDLMPTILDYAELRIPGFVQGKSLLPAISGGKIPARTFYVESLFAHEVLGCSPLAGVIDRNHKYLRLPRPEIYDLESDPAEKNNLYSPADGRAREMASALAACEARFGSSDFGSLREISPEEKKRLESLGYLASGPGIPSRKSEADPKDRVEFWNRSQEARRLVAADRYGEAEPLLLGLYQDDPRFGAVLEDIAEIYFKQNRPASLTAFFDAAVNRDPGNSALKLLYATYLVRFDLPGKAVGILEGAEESIEVRDREMFYFVLGNAYGRMANYQEAADALRKALDIEPDNYEAARLSGFTLMQLGRYSDALDMLGRAEKGLPDNPRLLEDKAMAHANLKEFGPAREYFEKVLAIAPAARVYANYALTFAAEGDYAKARIWMSKALSARDLDGELKKECLRFLRAWPDRSE